MSILFQLILFLLSVLALANALAALICLPGSRFSFPVFLFGLAPSELPIHWLAGQLILVLLVKLFGGFGGGFGTFTLLLFVLSWMGYLVVWWRSQSAEADVIASFRNDLPEALPQLDTQISLQSLLRPFKKNPPHIEFLADIDYGPALERDTGGRNQLDVYRLRGSKTKRRPALLQIHGGGWVTGNKKEQALPLMRALADRDWVCFSMNYRLAPAATWPDPIVDVKRAIVWIKEHAQEYDIDPDFLCLTGGSAGGQLAALAALTPNAPEFQPGFEAQDTQVAAVVPFYGPADFLNEGGAVRDKGRLDFLAKSVFKCDPKVDPEPFKLASPRARLTSSAPPMLMVQGSHDELVAAEEGREFAQRAREISRNPVVYLELKGAHHAFDIFYSRRSLLAVNAAVTFLNYIHTNDAQTHEPQLVESIQPQ